MAKNIINEEVQRIKEIIQKTSLDEFDERFNDVQAICVDPQQLVSDLNASYDRLKGDKPNMKMAGRVVAKLTTGGDVDINEFISKITKIPTTDIVSKNSKIEKTSKGSYLVYKLSLPPVKGLVYDIGEKEFKYVTTCPGAGTCIKPCYAQRGNYVQWTNSWVKQTQILNFLLNHPDKFKDRIKGELITILSKNSNSQVVLRWHDAGDFFSKAYMRIAIKITTELNKGGYNFTSYAYSKVAEFIDMPKPDNFITTFSIGAKPEEEEKIDKTKTKIADIVPRELFADLYQRKGKTYLKNDKEEWLFVNDSAPEELKNRIAQKFNVDKSRLVYDNELWDIPDGERFKYDVIVAPYHSDLGAIRKDVHHIYLLEH